MPGWSPVRCTGTPRSAAVIARAAQPTHRLVSSSSTTQLARLSDPPPERTRVLQVEVEPLGGGVRERFYGAHLLVRTGGGDDGFDARDVGG